METAAAILAEIEDIKKRLEALEHKKKSQAKVSKPVRPKGACEIFKKDTILCDAMAPVFTHAQDVWLKIYPKSYVILELKKAFQWIVSNPQKAPRSNYTKFYNGWLVRGWEKERRNIPAQVIPMFKPEGSNGEPLE